MAKPLFQAHVGGNLIHGHMAWPFDHHLYISIPGPLGQCP